MMTKRKSGSHSQAGSASSKRLCNGPRSQEPVTKATTDQTSQDGSSNTLPDLPPISAAMSKAVFTHQSILSNKENTSQHASYERLEFLGDVYVELMATRLIWDKFKDVPAGRLSQIRELLVKNETLGKIAVNYGLDERVNATASVRANPKQWAKVKGDLIEAYVAAVVLADDRIGGAGFAAAEDWLHQLWIPKLEKMLAEKAPDLNAKDALSRKVVSRGVTLEYLEERPMKQLQGGQQTYFIGAYLSGWGYQGHLLGRGQGLNKTSAGNKAAEDALQNPLIDKIAGMKREYDGATRAPQENGAVDQTALDKQVAQERMTRERELVEKKRNMFMSTEFG